VCFDRHICDNRYQIYKKFCQKSDYKDFDHNRCMTKNHNIACRVVRSNEFLYVPEVSDFDDFSIHYKFHETFDCLHNIVGSFLMALNYFLTNQIRLIILEPQVWLIIPKNIELKILVRIQYIFCTQNKYKSLNCLKCIGSLE